jgi:ATP-dependent RNA circularization protein (DNA/RNA ligase family)
MSQPVKFFVGLLIYAAVFAALWFVVKKFAPQMDAGITPGTVIIHDTTTVIRYNNEIRRDTVIKWYERIVTKQSDPVIIYKQKVDSVFLERIRYQDVMLKLEKRGKNLKIFAVNEKDSTLKEYFFDDVYSNFTATSAVGNIFVKSNRYELEPFRFSLRIGGPVDTWSQNKQVSLSYEPKLKIMETLELDAILSLPIWQQRSNTINLNESVKSLTVSLKLTLKL